MFWKIKLSGLTKHIWVAFSDATPLILILGFTLVICFNLLITQEQQFVELASAFLQGKTYFLTPPANIIDTIYWEGRYYWPPSPFPAVLLLPFVFVFQKLGLSFQQGYLQIAIVFLTFSFAKRLAIKYRFSIKEANILGFGFCFSTVYIGVALWSWSWQFSQTISVLLMLLAFWEYLGKKRYWVIGFFYSLIGATRINPALGLLFFASEIVILSRVSLPNKLKNLLSLMIFPALIFLFLLGYNYLRFGNFFQMGYSEQLALPFHELAREYGKISLVHVPRNLYYMFVSAPLPVFKDASRVLEFPFLMVNRWGMGMFVTSAMFIYLFMFSYKDRFSKLLIATVVAIMIPILLLYSSGGNQFGYRYTLDFLPFLYILLLKNYSEQKGSLTRGFKTVILINAFTNIYLFLTYAIGYGPWY